MQGGPYDDGYRPQPQPKSKEPDIKALQTALNAHGYNCGDADGIVGKQTTAAMIKALSEFWLR